MDRLVQRNVLAMSGRAVEAAGDVNTLLARQDRHHHPGQPAGHRVPAGRRRIHRGSGRRGPAGQPGRRDAGGSVDRRAGQERLRAAASGTRASAARPLRAFHRGDPDVRGGSTIDGRYRQIRKGAAAAVMKWVRDHGGHPTGGVGADRRRHQRLTAARRWWWPSTSTAQPARALGVDPPQGCGQGRHARAVRRDAPDGHPHRDDHRRQPADRPGDRRGGRRRRLPRRGHARGQDGPHPDASSRAAGWSR